MARIGMTLTSPNFTGACKMVRLYGNALMEAGHEVHLMHGRETGTNGQDKTFIDTIGEEGFKTILVPELATLYSPKTVRIVADHARAINADCVIGAQQRDIPVALKVCEKLQLPGVTFFQNKHRFYGRWPLPSLKEFVFARLVRSDLHCGICSSDAVRDELVERFRVAPEKTEVVYNGVDIENFPTIDEEERNRIRAEFQIEPDELMLVNVGRIDRQKGLEYLVEAFEIASRRVTDRRFKLVHVGEVITGTSQQNTESYFNSLKEAVAKAGLQDRFLFAGWRSDCPAVLKSADLYVHSAVWEGWPLAVLEAMGAKLPTIQTDCCGTPENYEQGKHGLIVPHGDGAALAEAVQSMVTMSEQEREQIGQAGYQFAADNYEIRKTSQRMVKLVEESLN